MATIKYSSVSSEVSLLTTELNSLGDDTLSSVGTGISAADNELMGNIKLVLGSQTARSAGAAVYVWLLAESGGDYSDATEDCLGLPDVIFTLDAATTARTLIKSNIKLPNSTFQTILKNSTGQAFNGSGNTLECEYYSIQSV